MVVRRRRGSFDDRPPKPQQGSWMVGMLVGLAVANMAAGAMLVGTGAAFGEALTGGKGALQVPKKG
ncbi:MAG: hypothetical protein JSR21_06220 [Proteobacteria bacterium]|nr:hypothetical protein [Pseudomonadota bacterium]